MKNSDEYFMGIALKEARKGLGRTAPNPCVGAVIVKEGIEVARGYHKKAGTPHAEINALRKAGDRAQGCTMYVTLEPCNHTGKTPPCSVAVAAAGIKKVVVGMTDPNPLVDGTGIDYLLEKGVEVVTGVLEDKCQELNRPFIKRITTGLPWVALKAGVSIDGKINFESGKSGWITGKESLAKVHRLRNQFDAIMVGRETVLIDDPSLTTRMSGRIGRDPHRIIVDSQLCVSPEAKIFHLSSNALTYVFCTKGVEQSKIDTLEKIDGTVVIPLESDNNGRVSISALLKVVADKGMNSILVEGGATLHGSMLKDRFADEAYIFQAPIFAGDGGISVVSGLEALSKSSSIQLSPVSYQRMGDDILLHGQVFYPGKEPDEDIRKV